VDLLLIAVNNSIACGGVALLTRNVGVAGRKKPEQQTMGLGIMLFHNRTLLSMIFCGALFAFISSNGANATPVIPPGFSAAVLDANIDAGYNSITDIATFTKTTGSTGYGRYFTANPGANEFVTVIPPQGGVIQSAFAAGVIAGLPGDPTGPVIDHLVVFGDFTTAEQSMSFASLFPGISESTLIHDLLTTPASTPLPGLDVNAFTADATADGLYGGNGSDFSVLAFSGGTDIGSGTVTLLTPATVPEPMSLAVFAAGLAGAAAMRRRKNSIG
jgi:hypothetical protein